MRTIIMSAMKEIDGDAKIAKSVALAGGSLSLGSIMEWLPIILGMIGTIIAIVLSVFLIYIHYKRNEREEELHKLEINKGRNRRSTD